MWEIVVRGMTPKEKSDYYGLGEPKSHWELLWKNASRFEKQELVLIWDRTSLSKWRKKMGGEKELRY